MRSPRILSILTALAAVALLAASAAPAMAQAQTIKIGISRSDARRQGVHRWQRRGGGDH